jgi:hypothetical protein
VTYSNTLLLAVFFLISLAVSGQVGVDYTLVKPKKFENRTLASEKSNDGKKFKKSRRFLQNTITHYNYYFNANVKLEMVLARAKSQMRDDYTRLLPFYNYTLEATLAQKRELDSVIYKCTMGILIHDTRNDWIDNLYLLIGKSYYLKKDFDSAYITFQFLNYAFAPKEKDGYDKPIASNYNKDEGGNANMVSTLEKRNVLQKVLSLPPSRNESLIWKIRTYIAKDQFAESASLIEILSHDPQFPPRLTPDLQEVRALWFYKQSINDSAAFYLEKALPAAANREEVARWEYLIAQLYEKIDRSFEAKTFYERTVNHTYNPILEIYARLNAIRQNKEGGADYIAHNIVALTKMARKDRFESYRDIIYYTAAQMELERNNKPGAVAFLLQCVKYAENNNGGNQRNKAFLQLANLSFEDKKYKAAKNFYDSLNLSDISSLGDISWLPDRKAGLAIIVAQLQIIARQDSLQRIAALPEAQRNAIIKKILRDIRRQQGLREDDQSNGFSTTALNANNSAVPDLFSTGSGNAEWYFYNSSLKSKGYNDFKTKWGTRPNVDNWQLSSLVRGQQAVRANEKTAGQLTPDSKAAGAAGNIDFKYLQNNLPLDPEKMKQSQDSIERALYALGKAYQDGIEDYHSAIATYDTLLNTFAKTPLRAETLLNLYYCYTKIGDAANAARILALMKEKYPGSLFTAKANNPDSVAEAAGSQKINATHQYERIYMAFIEGRFEEALAQKKTADSLYGDKYWTPQLLYIESVYFIRTQQDVKAKGVLNNIITKFAKTPMAAKAATLLDVLNRRRQIEDYLTKLQVTRVPDDSVVITPLPAAAPTGPARPRLVRNDSNMLVKEDTSQLARAKLHLATTQPGQQGKPSPAVPGMNKLKADTASMNKITMDAGQLARLRQQVDSINTAMQKAQSDSIQTALLRHQSDSIQAAMKKLQSDTAQLAAKIRSLNSVFTFTPDQPHSVLIVMDKVDPVYVSEAKNAFSRFNTENYFGLSLTANNASLSDSLKLVVIGNFANSNAALDYMQQVQALSPRAIIPWMPAGKYIFQVISGPNLELLLNNKDMPAYRRFLTAVYPGKF